MSELKTPESDSRVVDYLYGDLPEAERVDLEALLDDSPDAAAEVQSFSKILDLYRTETEEITPSRTATELLLKEAEVAHRPLWTRLFSDLIPRVVLRPAVAFAAVAILLVGSGVFYLLSREGRPRRTPAGGESTFAQAGSSPGPSDEERSALAAAAPVRKGAAALDALDEDRSARLGGAQRDQASTDTAFGKSNRPEANEVLAKKRPAARSASNRGLLAPQVKRKARDRGHSRPKKGKPVATRSLVASDTEGSAGRMPRKKPRGPTTGASPSAATGIGGQPAKARAPGGAGGQGNSEKRLESPPAQYNLAQTSLARGKVAVACRIFSSLVRNHRGYVRRADALLGWVRCEMARGNYARAARLARQLAREYPKWRKTSRALLVAIERRRQQRLATRREREARRVRRARKRAQAQKKQQANPPAASPRPRQRVK